jgi:hypothetical protein
MEGTPTLYLHRALSTGHNTVTVNYDRQPHPDDEYWYGPGARRASITRPPGTLSSPISKTVTVLVNGDRITKGENFFINLSSPSAQLGSVRLGASGTSPIS